MHDPTYNIATQELRNELTLLEIRALCPFDEWDGEIFSSLKAKYSVYGYGAILRCIYQLRSAGKSMEWIVSIYEAGGATALIVERNNMMGGAVSGFEIFPAMAERSLECPYQDEIGDDSYTIDEAWKALNEHRLKRDQSTG